jgi:hypothetical protein
MDHRQTIGSHCGSSVIRALESVGETTTMDVVVFLIVILRISLLEISA